MKNARNLFYVAAILCLTLANVSQAETYLAKLAYRALVRSHSYHFIDSEDQSALFASEISVPKLNRTVSSPTSNLTNQTNLKDIYSTTSSSAFDEFKTTTLISDHKTTAAALDLEKTVSDHAKTSTVFLSDSTTALDIETTTASPYSGSVPGSARTNTLVHSDTTTNAPDSKASATDLGKNTDSSHSGPTTAGSNSTRSVIPDSEITEYFNGTHATALSDSVATSSIPDFAAPLHVNSTELWFLRNLTNASASEHFVNVTSKTATMLDAEFAPQWLPDDEDFPEPLFNISAFVPRSSKKQRDRTAFFNRLFNGYDKRIPPSNDTVGVEAAIYLNSLDSVSEMSFDFDMGIYLRLKWNDPRLVFEPEWVDGQDSVNIDAILYEQLWVPDLFCLNEKKAHFHEIVTPNRLIFLSRNGSILYSSRLYFTLHCQMELHSFPFDSQFCMFQLHSYAYSAQRMQLKWAPIPLEMSRNLLIAQFTLASIEFEDIVLEGPRGNYSSLNVIFHFVRDVGFYVIQIYLPSFLIVLTAFTTFWIDPLAVQARVTIGVFTTLIMANMSFSFRSTLPAVSYVKAIDIWILACTLFVFTSLVQYTFVSLLMRQKPHRARLPLDSATSGDTVSIDTFVASPVTMTPRTPMSALDAGGVVMSEGDEENINQLEKLKDAAARERERQAGGLSGAELAEARHLLVIRQRKHISYLLLHYLMPHTKGLMFCELTGKERCDFLEAICRRVFPISFVIFNTAYWLFYLHFLQNTSHHGATIMEGKSDRHGIEQQ